MHFGCVAQQSILRLAALTFDLQACDFARPPTLRMMRTDPDVVEIGAGFGCQLMIDLASHRAKVFPAHESLRETGLIGNTDHWNGCIVESADRLCRSRYQLHLVRRIGPIDLHVDHSIAIQEDSWFRCPQ